MDENIEFILESTEEDMKKALDHLDRVLLKIRAGKANPVMLAGVTAEYYGARTPLNQLASVTAPDGRTLLVQPFDKSSIGAIERGITEANLGLNPQNDGDRIIVPIPMLTEERRRDLVRQAKDEGETTKIAIRNTRRDSNSEVKKLKEEGVSEDEIKGGEESIQNLTNKFTAAVDDKLKQKEAEIMTI